MIVSDETQKAILELQAKTRKLKREMYALIWSNPDKNPFQKMGVTIEYWVSLRWVDLKMFWKKVKLEWKNLQDR